MSSGENSEQKTSVEALSVTQLARSGMRYHLCWVYASFGLDHDISVPDQRDYRLRCFVDGLRCLVDRVSSEGKHGQTGLEVTISVSLVIKGVFCQGWTLAVIHLHLDFPQRYVLGHH